MLKIVVGAQTATTVTKTVHKPGGGRRAGIFLQFYLLVAVVVGDLEVPELGLHVVVLLGDAAELLGEVLVAFLVASVGLLVPLRGQQATGKKKK